MAGLGSRWGWWPFFTGFLLLRVAVIGGIASAAISLAGSLMTGLGGKRRSLFIPVLGLAISLVVVILPLTWYATAREAPRIHDITTDTEDPPRFVSVLPLREKAPNAASYGGPEIAAQQRAAYPDVKPLVLSAPPDLAFDRALAAAKSLGWRVVDTNRQEGRIEATDTTFWFGFKDDIVVRVRPEGSGSRIDIRSVSRVGVSDVGTNAARVRKFLKKLAAA
jgi:uncharacterized protein (DUF1499 family)